ncbi:MAG: alpha,alpha-trehalase TreF [Candidatus Saccharimonadales bacterium]
MKKINLTLPKDDLIKSTLVAATGNLLRLSKSPDEGLGQLFTDVQQDRVYTDGKTFVDLIPRRRMKHIQQEYKLEKQDPNFDLRDFVSRHFYQFGPDAAAYRSDATKTARQHISELWHVLERKNRRDRGSLIALPHAYIVPGGRFSEQFYWDSYFIMLGLAADGHWDQVEGMIKNYAYMIRKFGFIPTANRTYFLSRSQPPFLVHMVKLLARHKGKKRTLIEYLPYLVLEYRFWMKGKRSVNEHPDHQALARVVQLPNGVIMNRYYDNKMTPRPESLNEDIATVGTSDEVAAKRLFLHLRAGAESGWDFSSRWFEDPADIKTIHTTDIVPVDLNSLLYQLEITIAEAYRLMLQPILAKKFLQAAERRAETIRHYCWSETDQFFVDYDFKKGTSTGQLTLAAMFPLYAHIASSKQAAAVAKRIKKDFLKDGGLVTTLHNTGQQWDAPNGWAPLHWVAIEGLRHYGYHQLADEIKRRWVASGVRVYTEKGKMIEKYDVISETRVGGGGEYPLQDGFGWTNGVLAALLDEDTPKNG